MGQPHGSHFIRANNALAAGITTGIGIPLYGADEQEVSTVLAFLSSNNTPIARRFEVWRRKGEAESLTFATGIDQARDVIETEDSGRRIGAGEGLIGRALAEGIPVVAEGVESDDGYETLLAIPVLRGGRAESVVAFYN